MTPWQDTELLVYVASRAKDHPEYLGWVLARFVEREHLSQRALGKSLGITRRDLLRLGLCLRPRANHFADDIRQISARFASDAAVLAGIVRQVESLQTLTAAAIGEAGAESGLLVAARARKPQPTRSDDKGHPHAHPEP